tara:strand:- start:2299 stop:2457 length:159 start_codon:yes stop_codon:yes gene_type:complete
MDAVMAVATMVATIVGAIHIIAQVLLATVPVLGTQAYTPVVAFFQFRGAERE